MLSPHPIRKVPNFVKQFSIISVPSKNSSLINIISKSNLNLQNQQLLPAREFATEDINNNTMEFLSDFPPGPLDQYRKQASFNWKKMAITLEDSKLLQLKFKVWKILENDPLFAHSPVPYSLEESRRFATERIIKISNYEFVNENDKFSDPRLMMTLSNALGQYDWSTSLKIGLLQGFFINVLRGQGTGKHWDYVEDAQQLKVRGAICITEIGHGTNTRGLRTTATFDPNSQSFIINTPDFEAAKCWAGNLSKTATHAIVLAQLFTPDGFSHGLHNFIVPVRNPETMLPLPGITIGDMGAKLGLNGLDNGFLSFRSYKVSRDSLLNKNGDVTADGEYVSQQKDPRKRFGVSLGSLSAGRAGIVGMAAANLVGSVTISIRYSAVRRQFGKDGDEELPVIEYQMQQWRLFPYLASCYVWTCFANGFIEDFICFVISQFNSEGDQEELGLMGGEIHAISSAAKPVMSWLARDGIQESREACGGHGYLLSSGFGRLRNDNDANCTYEGDNNVLLQQTSNWLLNSLNSRHKLTSKSPLGALNFFISPNQHFNATKIEDLRNPTILLDTYKWLVRWLLKCTSDKLQFNTSSGKDSFTAKNDSQIYFAKTLSIAFIEWYVLEYFYNKKCKNENTSPEILNVLQKLFLLYGYWSLEKHFIYLYQGGFITSPASVNLIRQTILDLCTELKPEALALVDAIAPSDFILNSAIGKSDGQLYKNLKAAMEETPNCYERPSWWKDLPNHLENQKSKL